MTKYKGMNFQKWCALDIKDERKINYMLNGVIEGKPQTLNFTSEDELDEMMMFRVQRSVIESMSLVNDEWHVCLNY